MKDADVSITYNDREVEGWWPRRATVAWGGLVMTVGFMFIAITMVFFFVVSLLLELPLLALGRRGMFEFDLDDNAVEFNFHFGRQAFERRRPR